MQARALELMIEMGGIPPVAEVHVGMAQAHALMAQIGERDRQLEIARELGAKVRSPLMIFSVNFVAACYALDDGDIEVARCLASKALKIGSIQGYRNFTWWLPQQAARLCAFALEHEIEPAYARELIRSRSLLPGDDMTRLDVWPWPVRIHVLGHFSLLLDGRPVTLATRTQTRVTEMLKVLVGLGGQNIPDSQVSDLLWPDAEGDQARQSLKTTLHRLRKLIGQDAVMVSDNRLSLNPRFVWVDSLALDRLLVALEASDNDAIAELAGKAIDSYSGGFLPTEGKPWMLPVRERLRSRFLRIIGVAAERLCDLGQWNDAITCYEKALEVEPLAERFYVGLMRCHYELGQLAEGIMAYRRCREALASELDILPSAHAEKWHEKLRNTAS